jgi:hypothetical protein
MHVTLNSIHVLGASMLVLVSFSHQCLRHFSCFSLADENPSFMGNVEHIVENYVAGMFSLLCTEDIHVHMAPQEVLGKGHKV